MADSEASAISSCEEVPYYDDQTPKDIENSENLNTAELLKKLNPQHKNRLFYQIIKTKDIGHLLGAVLNEHGVNKDKFIYCLIQLFVDLSAYQHIDINYYVVHNDLKDIVSYMEKSPNSVLYKTGKYFVKMSKYTAKCNKIGEFLASFVMLSAKNQILYDPSIYIIFEILHKMSESKLRPIKHTGVFIALKLQTGLIRISSMIGQKLNTYQESLANETNSKNKRIFQHKIDKFGSNNMSVNKLIEFIYLKIFKNNWNNLDSQLHFMRNDCIHEVANWIHIFPDRFLPNDFVDILIKSIQDNHSMVRLSAIRLLRDILDKYYQKMQTKQIYKIIVEIGKRMNDVSYVIAITSVEILTFANDFIKLPHTVRNEICKLVYYPHYPLAAAAGAYLIERIHEHFSADNLDNNPRELLRMLFYFEKKSIENGFVNKYPLVIETIIDKFPVLQDIPVYISILEEYSSKMDAEYLTIAINILTESVYQTFLGTCSLIRPKQIERTVNPDKVKQMTFDLIKSLDKLTGLVSPLNQLIPLLNLIREYGVGVNQNENNTMANKSTRVAVADPVSRKRRATEDS